MSDFKSIDRYKLQQAFALAHKGQSDPMLDTVARARMRAIAKLLWDACGEDAAYSTRFSGEQEDALGRLADTVKR